MTGLLLGLAGTWAVEFAVYAVLLRRRWAFLLFCAVCLNTFTHPLVALMSVSRAGWLSAEAAAFGIEAGLLKALLEIDWPRALAVSAAANLASGLLGALLFGIPG